MKIISSKRFTQFFLQSLISIEHERTFWEKATILHSEYHRPKDKPMRYRLSRDIYDLCMMVNHKCGKQALANPDLLKEVVEYKKMFFSSKWANYDEAMPGKFRLVPPDHRIADLKTDYRQMREMFFEPPPDFEILIEQLAKIENNINST